MKSETPQYQPPPEDPQYTALKQRAQQDQITASQNQVRIDSASLLARYGAMVTQANAAGASAAGASPTMAAPNNLISSTLAAIGSRNLGSL